MKLDSEEQRVTLLKLLSTVTFTVTAENAQQTATTIDGIMAAIEKAGIEAEKEAPNALEAVE